MEGKSHASLRWALLPWSPDSERLGFSMGASGRAGVGPGPKALPRQRQSVMNWSPCSLPVAKSVSFPSSDPSGHHLTPHPLPDWRYYTRYVSIFFYSCADIFKG